MPIRFLPDGQNSDRIHRVGSCTTNPLVVHEPTFVNLLPHPQQPRPTAIFAVNNVRTLGMLRAINEFGLRIPDQLSVVGFDDSPWLSLLSPPLTTIRQLICAMGKEAVRLLMQRIVQGMDSPGVVTRMIPTLIKRFSTRSLI